MLTQARLNELFNYDPLTGALVRKVTMGRSGAGTVCSRRNRDGYLRVAVDGVDYLAHRLIWFMLFGWFPKEVDHDNRVRDDNRLHNLRAASRAGNMQNNIGRGNTSGFIGVSWDRKMRCWRARIGAGGVAHMLGYFGDPAAAGAAYAEAKRRLHEFHPEVIVPPSSRPSPSLASTSSCSA